MIGRFLVLIISMNMSEFGQNMTLKRGLYLTTNFGYIFSDSLVELFGTHLLMLSTQPSPLHSHMLHRIVFPAHCRATVKVADKGCMVQIVSEPRGSRGLVAPNTLRQWFPTTVPRHISVPRNDYCCAAKRFHF